MSKVLVKIKIWAMLFFSIFLIGRIFADVDVSKGKLSQVKVAVQYRYVTDGKVINRSLDDVIKILKDTKTQFLFQGWMTQKPCPDRCSDLPWQKREKCRVSGYSYEHLKEAILKIKKKLPDIIFCGGTQAEFLYPEEAGKSYLILEPQDRDKAWKMALDPKKWGVNFSKRDCQCYWARRWGDIGKNEPCPTEEELKQRMRKFFPDLTNPNFQKIFLKRIYKQIDAGVDAIWIDMLYVQARLMEKITKNPNHPAVRESYKAAKEIVDKIHEYGKRKGRYIYVITWVTFKEKNSIVTVPEKYLNVDAAMVTPHPNEIKDKFTGEIGNFNEELWDELVKKIKKEYGIPIFARIDYGGLGRTPLYVFSQELSKKEAREFLKIADEFFSKKGIVFIYPVHGGDMGEKESVKKLSYGKFNWYDSLAPEFETYGTIKKLAQSKIFEIRVETICDDRVDNDGDGLIDNEDGDCWIKEGAILGEEYYVATKYSDYIKIIPELKDIGIKTIEMFPIWEHCNSPDPSKRWAVRDFDKLDPKRGTERELKSFLKTAHKYNIKVITMLSEWASALPPTPECTYFDSTGDGGALYRYQIENPDKNILIKDESGKFICHCCGYGYAPDPTSQDVINFFLKQYKKIQNYGFDGLRLDASAEFTCKKDEKINTCPYKFKERPCPEPVGKDYPLQNYYRALSKLKKPSEIWHAESASVKRVKIPVEKNPLCRFPFYYPDTTNDEYAEISSSHFNMILPYLFKGKINSADFVKLLKKEPVAYNRIRLRGVIKKDIGEVLTKESMNFVVNDPRYFPSVVLVSTIPGVPYVGLYELFGSRLADKLHGISGDSVATAPKRRAFWKKVLNIRNNNNALKYGTIKNVWKSGDNVYAYLREYKDEKVVVLVNFLKKKVTSYLDLSFLPKGSILYDVLNKETFIVYNPDKFKIYVPAYGSRILIPKSNTPPYISPLISDLETKEDTVLRYDLTKHENDKEDDNEALTWSVLDVNPKLFKAWIEKKEDLLTIQPLPDRYGEDDILLVLSDSGGLTAHQRVKVKIKPVNDPPVLNPIGDKKIDEGKLLRFKVTGYDIDDDKLTYKAYPLPKGAVFKNQIFSWRPNYNQAGKYKIRFTVKDPHGLSDSETITIKVNNVNRDPALQN